MEGLMEALLFWVAADFIIESHKLLHEAQRCERYNPPWARNRRRKAGKYMDRAKSLCGDRCLPWGVRWPEE